MVSIDTYEDLIRSLAFRLPADTAHELGKLGLRWSDLARAVARRDRKASDRLAGDRLATDLGGLRVTSPIGLAPGFDKSGDLVPALAGLGFGYITIGSITVEPRAGNPRPRLVRYPERQSLANCMGMPNRGIEAAVRALSRPRRPGSRVIAAVAGFSVEELLGAAAAVEPYVDAVEIGLVCRNTPESFQMAELPTFIAVAAGLAGRRKPTFAKLPPHHTDAELARTLSMVDVCLSGGFDGLSISGTRTVQERRLSMGQGGIAGRDTTPDALRILGDVATRTQGRLPIRAAGGVFDGADAYRFLEAGASAVEVYSAFIYRGWGVASKVRRELLQELDRRDLPDVRAIRRDIAPATPREPVGA